MYKHQKDKSISYHKTIDVATEFKPVWETHPEFSESMLKFITGSGAIDSQASLQEQNITGIAIDKSDKKIALVAITLNVSGAVQTYANKTKNNELFKKMAFTKSKLSRSGDATLTGKVNLVIETARGLGALLVPFGITPVILDALQEANNDYKDNFLTKPKIAIDNRKNITTDKLPLLFEQTDDVLRNQLLKMISQFNDVNPDFVSRFIFATYIGSLGLRHTRLSIVVKVLIPSDSMDTMVSPAKNALVVIEDTGLSGNTNDKGKLTITKVPEKATKVLVTYKGVTKEYTVTFARGKATKLTVEFAGAFTVPNAAPVAVPIHA